MIYEREDIATNPCNLESNTELGILIQLEKTKIQSRNMDRGKVIKNTRKPLNSHSRKNAKNSTLTRSSKIPRGQFLPKNHHTNMTIKNDFEIKRLQERNETLRNSNKQINRTNSNIRRQIKKSSNRISKIYNRNETLPQLYTSTPRQPVFSTHTNEQRSNTMRGLSRSISRSSSRGYINKKSSKNRAFFGKRRHKYKRSIEQSFNKEYQEQNANFEPIDDAKYQQIIQNRSMERENILRNTTLYTVSSGIVCSSVLFFQYFRITIWCAIFFITYQNFN